MPVSGPPLSLRVTLASKPGPGVMVTAYSLYGVLMFLVNVAGVAVMVRLAAAVEQYELVVPGF